MTDLIQQWEQELYNIPKPGSIKRFFLRIVRKIFSDRAVRIAQRIEALELLEAIPARIVGVDDKLSADNLRWMMQRTIDEMDIFPVDKTGRWIGYVQGILAIESWLNVDNVRDRSRPRFQHAYKVTGQTIPKTQERVIQS